MGFTLSLRRCLDEGVDELYARWGYALYLRYGRKGSGSGPSRYVRTSRYVGR